MGALWETLGPLVGGFWNPLGSIMISISIGDRFQGPRLSFGHHLRPLERPGANYSEAGPSCDFERQVAPMRVVSSFLVLYRLRGFRDPWCSSGGGSWYLGSSLGDLGASFRRLLEPPRLHGGSLWRPKALIWAPSVTIRAPWRLQARAPISSAKWLPCTPYRVFSCFIEPHRLHWVSLWAQGHAFGHHL